MSLIILGITMIIVAGVWGLTVSASDLSSEMPDLRSGSLTYEQEAGPVRFPMAYERAEIPEAVLAFDVPTSWQQLDQEQAWSPTGDGEHRIGVSWFHLTAGSKQEAILLPGDALIVESTPVRLAWGVGRQYLIKNFGPGAAGQDAWAPALSVELHTIITVADGTSVWAYDLHAVAPTEEELILLRPILDTMLRSMRLTTPPPG